MIARDQATESFGSFAGTPNARFLTESADSRLTAIGQSLQFPKLKSPAISSNFNLAHRDPKEDQRRCGALSAMRLPSARPLHSRWRLEE